MDVVTSVLELVGLVLLVAALGLGVASLAGGPAGLAVFGLCLVGVSALVERVNRR